MEHEFEKALDKNISRITLFPIALAVAIFLVSVAVILYGEQKQRIAGEEEFLTELISVQRNAFQNEIFTNREEALRMRLSDLVKNDRLQNARLRACVRIVPMSNQLSAQTFTQCTNPSDDFEMDSPGRKAHELIISAGVKPMAKISYFTLRQPSFSDVIPPELLFAFLFAVVCAWLLHRLSVRRLEKNVVSPLLKKITKDERNAAIAQTIQMVAHDVRKPFLELNTGLESLRGAKDQADFEALRLKFLPTLERSVSTVNAMLADVMEFGSLRQPDLEETSVIELILNTQRMLLPLYSTLNVKFAYDFNHPLKALADTKRIFRVFSNLIENALQAVEVGGTVRFRSRVVTELGTKRIEIAIGNTGSVIPPETLEKIFEPFFTSKRSGYGLGLAIASKMVTDHGGRIWATSSPEEGTEFLFTLPLGTEAEDYHKHRLPLELQATSSVVEFNKISEPTREKPILQSNGQSILVFDDEPLVHEVWRRAAEDAGITKITHFSSWEDFVKQDGFDLVPGAIAFVDINFKHSRFSGIEVAKHLKKLGVSRLFAITGDPVAATRSGLFHQVLGKEFPFVLKRKAGGGEP